MENRSNFLRIVTILISLLVLIAIAAAGFYGWRLQKNINQLHEQVNQQQQTLNVTSKTLQTLTSPQEKRMRSLAEAEYLVRLANLNLNFEGNIPFVLHLLKTADQQIAALQDPTLTTIRQTLINDITALNAVPSVDLDGLIMRLNAVSQQINQLPAIPSEFKKSETQTSAAPAAKEPSAWKRSLESVGHALKQAVVVRHIQQPVEPLISPEQQAYLIQNIQLKLSQAQWAVLHQQPDVYQQSLQQSAVWIRQYFVQNSSATQNVLKAIEELEKINIKPLLPNISDSLNAIENALNKYQEPPSV